MEEELVRIGNELIKEGMENEKSFADEYDVAMDMTQVHSQESIKSGLNKDFIYADLNQAQIKFVKEQFKLITQIGIFMEIEEKIKDMVSKEDLEKIKNMRERLIHSFIHELKTIAILTRAKNGKLINKYLDGIWKMGKKDEEEKGGIIQKIIKGSNDKD